MAVNKIYVKCDVCGKPFAGKSAHKTGGRILCPRHYYQLYVKGKILDNQPYSRQDPPTIEIDGIVGYIPVVGTYSYQKVIIDAEDKQKLSGYRFHMKNGSVLGYKKGKEKTIAKIILGLENDPNVTRIKHINGNNLDNRKCNLRVIYKAAMPN